MDREWLRLQGIRPVMLLLTGLSLLQGIAIIAQALLLSKAITLLFAGHPWSESYEPLAYFLMIFIVRHCFVWLQQRTAGRFAEHTSESLREHLLTRIFERGPRFAAKEGSGKLVTLALEGIDRVRTYLELSIPRMMDMLFVTMTILFVVFKLDFLSGIILIVAMPVLVMFFIILGYAARAMADKQWQSYRRLSHHFTDSLRGLETLAFLGRSREHGESVGRAADQYRSATMRTLRVAFMSSLSLDFFSMLSIAFVAVGLGLRLIDGSIGMETALAILLLAPEYFLPIRMLGTDYHASLDGKEAWGTIRKIIEVPDAALNEQDDKALEGETDHMAAASCSREEKADPGSGLGGSVQLSAIQVAGADGTLLLKDVSVCVEDRPARIGIVGASGAGKTTLLNVLGGFIEPTAGEVLMNGQTMDSDSSVRQQWQRQIAYIPQHPYIFSMSVADNIRFYDAEATIEQVDQAIDAVGLRELVNSLPQGRDERIGEGGRAVSGGQAQRIALARALLGHRPIILLDEPTAHLDVETEWELKQTMLSIFAGKQVFLATHRLHWMLDMDEVWVLHQGRLVQQGTHEILKGQAGIYNQLLAAGGRRAE